MDQQNPILASYQHFCSQLQEVTVRYPNLSVKQTGILKCLKGILDIPNDTSEIVGSFLIEIHWKHNFPYRFPVLYEVGGIIPNEADWHKGLNNFCCITVEPDEIIKCKSGITVIQFIESYAIPFFANYLYRKENGFYKNGEYAHSTEGIRQFYCDLLKTSDTNLWLEYFKNVFRDLCFDNRRNQGCFCGSQLKYKKCHKPIFDLLYEIGEQQVLSDFEKIIQ